MMRFGIQDIVVQAALLGNAPLGLHRDKNAELLIKDLAVKGLAHNIRLHGDETVFHRETPLVALPVRLHVKQPLVVLARL